jgi:ribosomal protein S24E
MEMKIIKHEKNLLLKREEYMIKIDSKLNPTFDDVKKFLGKSEELIVVKKIEGNFGKQSFIADAVVYTTKEDKKNIEMVPQKVRKKLEEEAKKKVDEAKAAKAAESAKAAEGSAEATK